MRRMTILLGVLAALMLVPAAQAMAGTYTINIEGIGSGEGSVNAVGEFGEGSPPVACEGPPSSGSCTGTLNQEEGFYPLYVSATAGSESEFLGWEVLSGNVATGCEEGAECLDYVFSESEDIELTAYFGECESEEGCGPTKYPLTVNKTGSGEGTVTSGPTGINCGETCSHEFEEGVEVTLTAKAAEGSKFTGYTGAGCPEGGYFYCELTMSEAKEVTANFEEEEVAPEQPLTLKINEGEGTVVSDPAGITCTGASGTECTEEFPEGEEVTLTASPAAGYRFQQWQTCPSGNFGNRQCTVTMSEAKEVGVKFKRVYDLTIVKAGSGLGSVYNNKNGLTCTLRCQTVTIPFPEGVSFTLTGEAPNKEFYFKEFTGGTGSAAACSGIECTMTLSEASTVEAVFEDRPTETLSIDKEGGGTAKIWGLLWCSENCTSTSGDFFSGEPSAKEVVVNWELAPGTSSIEWTSGAGTCTGTKTAVSGSCKVTMDEAHALVAKLE